MEDRQAVVKEEGLRALSVHVETVNAVITIMPFILAKCNCIYSYFKLYDCIHNIIQNNYTLLYRIHCLLFRSTQCPKICCQHSYQYRCGVPSGEE